MVRMLRRGYGRVVMGWRRCIWMVASRNGRGRMEMVSRVGQKKNHVIECKIFP